VIEQFVSDVPVQVLNPAVVVLVDLIAPVLKVSAVSIDDGRRIIADPVLANRNGGGEEWL